MLGSRTATSGALHQLQISSPSTRVHPSYHVSVLMASQPRWVKVPCLAPGIVSASRLLRVHYDSSVPISATSYHPLLPKGGSGDGSGAHVDEVDEDTLHTSPNWRTKRCHVVLDASFRRFDAEIRQGACTGMLLEFLWKLLQTCKHECGFQTPSANPESNPRRSLPKDCPCRPRQVLEPHSFPAQNTH
jgi:hypothetical protein